MKTTTITREYDAEGRCVRETRVEVERPDPQPYRWDDGQWWLPQPGWWQNPTITCTTSTTAALIVVT